MTREELVGVNSKVMTMVLDGATQYSPDAIFVVVSNPMDTMTMMTVNYLGKENWRKVIGMGGMLDSARFEYNIRMKLYAHYGLGKYDIAAKVIGGLDNTVIGYPLDNSTGFNLWGYDGWQMKEAIDCALKVYNDRYTFNAMRKSVAHQS